MRPTFDEVYRECHQAVFAVSRRILRDDNEAEDATQETFCAVAQGLKRFRGESQIKTWVHRIAIRTALRVRGARREDAEPANLSSQLADRVTDSELHPAERDRVNRAWESLSYDHRVVLALFAIAGMTHSEIAAVIGVPEGTVWSRLHAGKRRLAALLGVAPAAATGVAGTPPRHTDHGTHRAPMSAPDAQTEG